MMADVKNWSAVAGDNSEASPDGAPENMTRSGVNDTMRENMAALREFYAAAEWVTVYVTTGDAWLASRQSVTQILLTPQDGQATDISSRFPTGSRVKLTGGATQYGFVSDANPSGNNTIVDVDVDGGVDVDASTNLMEISVVRDMLGKTAYYPTGVTRSQSPPQVPTIDDLSAHVTKSEGAGGTIDADTVDGYEAAALIAAASGSVKNLVHNPEFQVWQRGLTIDADTTSGRIYINSNNLYTADRWRLLSGNAATPANDMVDVARDLTSVPTGYWSAALLTAQAGIAAQDKAGLFQVLEGRDAAVMIKSAAISMGVELMGSGITNARFMVLGWTGAEDHADLGNDPINNWNNTGDVPTFNANWSVLLDSGQTAITGTWTRYTKEDVDISAATTVKNLAILIIIDDTFSAGNTLGITGIRLENGSEASGFVHTEPALELMRCSRYYTNTFDDGTDPRDAEGIYSSHLMPSIQLNTPSRVNFIGVFRYPSQMRVAPAIKIWNPSSTTADSFYEQLNFTDILQSAMIENISDRHVNWTLQNSYNNRMICAHIAANAEF